MVLLKVIFVAILCYYVARTVGNLYQAVLNDPKATARVRERSEASRDVHWQGPRTKRAPRREADVEDARWVDLPN